VAFVFGSGAFRRPAVFAAGIFVSALVAVLLMASGAKASELVYWDNYRSEPGTVSVANIDGSGGGALNLTGITLEGPEGMDYDPVANRLYIASSSGGPTKKGEIVFVNLDGSGAGVLSTPGAEVNEPYGVAIDPTTRTIYWTNGEGGPEGKGSIAYARLDGSGGGPLNTTGVAVLEPYRLAVDPVSGKVFWANTEETPNTLAFANLNNTGGGGTLGLPVPPSSMYGLAVDSAAGRVYWLNSKTGEERLMFANVNGSGGGEVGLTGAVLIAGYGLAIDSALGRIYWGNYGNGASVPEAIGFVNLAGGGGAITPSAAPVNGAQDPVILKSPVSTARPKLHRRVLRGKHPRSKLTCSTNGWALDNPGTFVYQSPRSYTYKWKRSGKKLGGTKATRIVKTPGKYVCIVTATNSVGSASRASKPVKVKKPRKKRH
jgi:hypothetical protein